MRVFFLALVAPQPPHPRPTAAPDPHWERAKRTEYGPGAVWPFGMLVRSWFIWLRRAWPTPVINFGPLPSSTLAL